MKKTAVFMAVILFLLSIVTGTVLADSAYGNGITPSDFTIDHTLQLTVDPWILDFDVEYTFTVGTIPEQMPVADSVVGNPPTITSVSYGPSDDFTAAPHSKTKKATVQWNEIKLKEPGLYVWKVTKTQTKKVPTTSEPISNLNSEFYLYAYVLQNELGELSTTTFIKTSEETKELGTDTYPATTVDLTIKKSVAGNQASRDQYFKFDITIQRPVGSSTERAFTMEGYDLTEIVQQSIYNKNSKQPEHNPNSFSDTVSVWLKHGQSVTIKNLPYGSTFTVTEDPEYAKEYVTTAKVTKGDATVESKDGTIIVSDASMTASTEAEFTNEKEITPPTGIDLESDAPVMGMILAAGLLSLVFAPKRRKENS